MRVEDIKGPHEKSVTDGLLRALAREAIFLRAGDPGKAEPDVIYEASGQSIGIEVATAYYDNRDAAQEWTAARGVRKRAKIESRFGDDLTNNPLKYNPDEILEDPDGIISRRVQGEINDKCSKRYQEVDTSWLCIAIRAPLSDRRTINRILSEVVVPSDHGFERIYLYSLMPDQDGGGYQAFLVFPR